LTHQITTPIKPNLHAANFAAGLCIEPRMYRILTACIQVQGSVQAFQVRDPK